MSKTYKIDKTGVIVWEKTPVAKSVAKPSRKNQTINAFMDKNENNSIERIKKHLELLKDKLKHIVKKINSEDNNLKEIIEYELNRIFQLTMPDLSQEISDDNYILWHFIKEFKRILEDEEELGIIKEFKKKLKFSKENDYYDLAQMFLREEKTGQKDQEAHARLSERGIDISRKDFYKRMEKIVEQIEAFYWRYHSILDEINELQSYFQSLSQNLMFKNISEENLNKLIGLRIYFENSKFDFKFNKDKFSERELQRYNELIAFFQDNNIKLIGNESPTMLSKLKSFHMRIKTMDELSEKVAIVSKENKRKNEKQNISAEKLDINKTEKEALILSRVGQGTFRESLMKYWEGQCSVTGCQNEDFLRASHIKPWRDSDNSERLDVFNGLLLIPNLDVAFDKGFISFDDNGKIMPSSSLSGEERNLLGIHKKMGIEKDKLNEKHKKYLNFHRKNVFKK